MHEISSNPRRSRRAVGAPAILLGAALVVAVCVAPATAAEEQTVGSIVLRVYNTYRLAGPELETARATVRDVFEAAGVQMAWRECPNTGLDPCEDRLQPNDVVVRLIRSPAVFNISEADLVLGYASLQHEPRRGGFTTVYPDRVETVARRFSRDLGVLIGRAIAHEIGHLFLETKTHAARGLMRARWSGRPMKAPTPQDWIFSSSEAQQLRKATRARAILAQPVQRVATTVSTAQTSGAH